MRISIIIPVYNSEEFLKKCLLSISRQTYTDFDCILVDDGSSDGSGRICDEWSKRDGRFRVIHQTNKGVSQARNIGLSLCNTQWVTFIDSDDWLNDNFLNLMVEAIYKYPLAKVIISSSWTHYSNRVSHSCVLDNSGCFGFENQFDNAINELLIKYKIMAPWGKLYNMSIINKHNLKFPADISFGEDLIFNIAYFSHIDSFVNVKDAIYNYIVRDGSLSKKLRDFWNINYSQWIKLFSLFQSKNIKSQLIDKTIFGRLWGIIEESMFKSKDLEYTFRNEYKYIRSILNIPEIKDKRFQNCDYKCCSWIKYIIINRHALLFVLINRYIIYRR